MRTAVEIQKGKWVDAERVISVETDIAFGCREFVRVVLDDCTDRTVYDPGRSVYEVAEDLVKKITGAAQQAAR